MYNFLHPRSWHAQAHRRMAAICAAALMAAAGPLSGQESQRRVALTFDDLVMTAVGGVCAPTVAKEVNAKILSGLARAGLSATGFVNASRTCGVEVEELRNPLLRDWLNAGHVLGNHTWSHPDLESMSLDDYLADAARGGEVVDSLLAGRADSLVWFRHPQLHAGETPAKKAGLARFLEERGWRVAPVTVDNQEWMYAYVYHMALQDGDDDLADRVAAAFLEHLENAFAYFERRSREVVGREVAQVLLLHVNRLVADHIDEILGILDDRGYSVVTLAEALDDPAYERGDPWTGAGGPSWIERWAVAGGGEAREGPREHDWVAVEFRRLQARMEQGPERVETGGPTPRGGKAFPVLSPGDGTLWFATHDENWESHHIVFSTRDIDGWRTPEPAPFSTGTSSDRAPRFSPDGTTLFFASNRPRPGEVEHDPRDYDLWSVTREPDGSWGEPRFLPAPVSTNRPEYHPSPAASGAIYFASFDRPGGRGRSDLYVARPCSDGWRVEHLDDRLNSDASEPDVYVDPQERFLIITSTGRPDGYGGDDLYLSVREGGGWSAPRHLGVPVNSASYEYGATVSPDGRWLWFTSHRGGSAALYRIRTAAVPGLAQALDSPPKPEHDQDCRSIADARNESATAPVVALWR